MDGRKENRSLAIGLSIGAAACLIYACFAHAWLANASRYDKVRFGLLSVYDCDATVDSSSCKPESNHTYIDQLRQVSEAAADQTSSAFAPTGWATLVLCLLAAAGLLGAAGIALAGKRPDLPITPSTIALLALMTSLITGCVFVATKPGGPGFVGVGMTFWIFGVGSVLGIAGAQQLARINRPIDPDLAAGAMDPEQF